MEQDVIGKTTKEKTLMSTYDMLLDKSKRLEELVRMSEIIIEKIEMEREDTNIDEKKEEKPGNIPLLDMFYAIGSDMDKSIDKIRKNLNSAINFIG